MNNVADTKNELLVRPSTEVGNTQRIIIELLPKDRTIIFSQVLHVNTCSSIFVDLLLRSIEVLPFKAASRMARRSTTHRQALSNALKSRSARIVRTNCSISTPAGPRKEHGKAFPAAMASAGKCLQYLLYPFYYGRVPIATFLLVCSVSWVGTSGRSSSITS